MKNKNIESVIDAWFNGEAHEEKTCHTDGVSIWSYELKVAQRDPDGSILILEKEKLVKPDGKTSVTTVKHSNTIQRALPGAEFLEVEVIS